MEKQHRFVILSLVLALMVAGCAGGAFGSFRPDESLVEDTNFTQTMQWFRNGTLGPMYEIALELPEEWVENFTVTTTPSRVEFNFINERGDESPIFTIEALNDEQYWSQNGSYPQEYVNVKNTRDTFFIYNVPRIAFYSGLSQEEFESLAMLVPDIMTTFSATLSEDSDALADMPS